MGPCPGWSATRRSSASCVMSCACKMTRCPAAADDHCPLAASPPRPPLACRRSRPTRRLTTKTCVGGSPSTGRMEHSRLALCRNRSCSIIWIATATACSGVPWRSTTRARSSPWSNARITSPNTSPAFPNRICAGAWVAHNSVVTCKINLHRLLWRRTCSTPTMCGSFAARWNNCRMASPSLTAKALTKRLLCSETKGIPSCANEFGRGLLTTSLASLEHRITAHTSVQNCAPITEI